MTFLLASAALVRIGPIVRACDLRARGVTSREISRATSAGEIRRVRRGVYASLDADESWIHAAQHGAVPSCVMAGRMMGLWILQDGDDLHLWFGHAGNPRQCGRRSCDPHQHWDDGEVRLGDLPPVRNVLLQVAQCADEETFFCALESALRKSMLHVGDIRWLAERVPRPVRWLLGFARTDADSGLESLIRLRLHKLGISVCTQVQIDGVGEVDFVIGDWLIIEADGKQNHDDDRDDEGGDASQPWVSLRHKDLMRDARAAALGYETLRFNYAMIVHHWATVVAAILARIAATRVAPVGRRVSDH
ncbi:type IV toxin-antitoxin system AbiEi family antitoxin domain-containing protein [Microbacterium sp. H1-D42]|uniref:type IV toxin-antitoxin system AbiEi family antitoxin domain-containing protein n=1 Tax=Microbacterium sp. H1-D42 TaxID=2925844 RepID=UPI001F52CD2B|nr:type IV toxin-antitoxin system AbiEi family antitoxin domain-containing protein [Microbacterium sp. H1-D42]UNK71766.1 type IV toxin-antitoxin system AbiEi family antitoxin domain-containing protein [Microbacterium sp. H1-D42]